MTATLTPAAVLEITKPSAGLGIARPLIVGAANGDAQGQREIRDAYLRLSFDTKLPIAALVAAAECAVITARFAASHGDLNDVVILADALWRSAVLFESAGIPSQCQSRLIESLSLYKRLSAAGYDGAEEFYQRTVAAVPLEIVALVEEENQRFADEGGSAASIASTRIH